MTNRTRAPAALLLSIPLALCCVRGGGSAQATQGVEARYEAWRGCLQRSFGLQAVLTSRALAADTALRACRPSEGAYLTALSASPMVDGDDVARVRPALLLRAKGWLLGRGPSPSL